MDEDKVQELSEKITRNAIALGITIGAISQSPDDLLEGLRLVGRVMARAGLDAYKEAQLERNQKSTQSEAPPAQGDGV